MSNAGVLLEKFSGLLHVFVQLFAFERISCRSSVFCKGGVDMEPKKPLGDVDDLIFQEPWEVSQR